MDNLKNILAVITKRLKNVEDGKSPSAVTFGGQTFEKPADVGAWMEAGNLDVYDAGYIVNPHIVMEHVYGSLMG